MNQHTTAPRPARTPLDQLTTTTAAKTLRRLGIRPVGMKSTFNSSI